MEISNELKSHFLRLYQMALSDEDFSPLELKKLYQFASQRGISSEELNHILLTETTSLVVPQDVETKIEYLYDLALMAWADNIIEDEEVAMLKKYCKIFGFRDENIDSLIEYLLEKAKEKIPSYKIIEELK